MADRFKRAFWGVWSIGFRPFYLLAALLSAVSVPLWVLQYSGLLWQPIFETAEWHAHEMIFGYALAVIVGFLLTASRNWTGRSTPAGRHLMALAALWLLARLLILSPWITASMLVNLAVPWAAAWSLWRVLNSAQNRRNYFFVALLVVMGCMSAALHLQKSGILDISPSQVVKTILDLVMFVIAVMAGRVVPMFSNNGIPGLNATRNILIERMALGSVLVLACLDTFRMQGVIMAVLLILTMMIHAVRWVLWKPWRTRKNALVWVLHAAYFWLPMHLILRAGAEMQWIASGVATHALTMGLLGMITLGMMTRTALGHTGHPVKAGAAEVWMYSLVMCATMIRVIGPLVEPLHLLSAVQSAAVLWSSAFALYLWRYTPILISLRPDGQPD